MCSQTAASDFGEIAKIPESTGRTTHLGSNYPVVGFGRIRLSLPNLKTFKSNVGQKLTLDAPQLTQFEHGQAFAF